MIGMGQDYHFDSEDVFQAHCFQWFWNTFPQSRYLLHCNNNNSANGITGNQNKAKGVVKGVADLEFYRNGKLTFIELKLPNKGQFSEQKEFQAKVEAEGFRYEIVKTFEDFKKLMYELLEG